MDTSARSTTRTYETAFARPKSNEDTVHFFGAIPLSNGLYFEDGEFEPSTRVMLGGYTEELDRFYGQLPGEQGGCPSFPISEWYRAFVSSLEACGAPGRTEAAKMLLSLDGKGQRRIETMVTAARQQVLADGMPHDVTVVGGEFGGVCIAFTPQLDDRFRRARRAYTEMKRHQLKLPRFVLVMQELGDVAKQAEIDVVEGDVSDPIALDHVVGLFSRARVAASNRLGRNELCPCNSGRKFKKCCAAR